MAKKKSNLDLTALMGQLNQDPDLTTYSETELGEVRTWVPTLIPEFDYNLVGGIPATGQVSEVAGPPSSGKALDNNTIIPTPKGDTKLSDIKVGDYVFDEKGKPTKVLGVYPKGKLNTLEVVFKDGRKAYVNNEHIWGVYSTHKRSYLERTTQEIIDSGVYTEHETKWGKPDNPTVVKQYNYNIPVADWSMYPEQELPLHPYVMGALLGDGCLTERQLTISSDDPFVVNKVSDLLPYKNHPVKKSDHNFNWTFALDEEIDGIRNNVTMIQTSMVMPDDLAGANSYTKYIPKEYLKNSRENREMLMQGLVDTDGNVNKKWLAVSYSTVSPQLKHDISMLSRSLGYLTNIHVDDRTHDKNSIHKHVCYSIVFKGKADKLGRIVTLPRKKQIVLDNFSVKHNYDQVPIVAINDLHEEREMTCLYVDSDSHLFLANDYIVTHNTTFAGSIIKNAIKMGFLIVYFDVESTQHSSRLQQLGVDPSKVLTMTPSRLKDGTVRPLSIESIGQKIIDILAEVHTQSPDTPVLFTWDSVAITQSDMQADADIDQQLVGQQAKALASIGRKIQSNLVMNNGTLLAFNQARDDFQAANPKYAQQKTTGGKGWEHLLSTRITFQQAGKIKVSASDNEAIGTHTRIKVPKSKVGDNFDSNFTVELIGAQGYDFEYNMVVEAQEQGFINKGNWPHYVTDDGEDIKEQNVYKLANRFKDPDLIEIKTELWQKIIKHYFPECYPPLFNTTGFMHVKDFPIIKGLRKYYADIQEKLPLEQRAYNYNDFMSALANDDIPEDIVAEMNEPAPDPTPADEGAE